LVTVPQGEARDFCAILNRIRLLAPTPPTLGEAGTLRTQGCAARLRFAASVFLRLSQLHRG
jgi:hypothetical protein